MFIKRLTLCLGLVGSCFLLLQAQPRADVELLLGGAAYQGDLQHQRYPDPKTIGGAVGVRGSLNLRPAWALQLGLLGGRFTGTDALSDNPDLRLRNFSFESTIVEGGLQLRWEPFSRGRYPAAGGYKGILSPYVYGGVGLYHSDTRTTYGRFNGGDSQSEPVRLDREMLVPTTQLTIPIGGGIRLDLGANSSIGLELAARPAMNDFLDRVSNSGNANEPDWYAFGLVTISRRFHRPDWDHDGIVDVEDACPREPGLKSLGGCPDADLDGVPDHADLCPYQQGRFEERGCPDLDLDGVADILDDCKAIPGSPRTKGCPDTDDDGIMDDEDACPDCPGPRALSGCPDRDGDGITDARDRCPSVAGKWEFDGCPFLDTDYDGMPDSLDACPTLAGPREDRGCPDSDGDGIADDRDVCPEIAGVADNRGCPPVPDSVRTVLTLATKSVQFETGSARLKPQSSAVLNQIALILKLYDYYNLRIAGHTDSQGNDKSNMKLSQNRAKACFDYLVGKGVAPERLVHVGYGETQPIASNKTAAGRSQNRRVNFDLFIP